jgi:hypothetical protein
MIDFLFDDKRNHADDIIDGLVGKVLAAYPEERLGRIRTQSEYTWNSANYKGAGSGRISYVVLNGGVPEEPKIPDDASDVQKDMIYQLKLMLYNSDIDDEYYPGFSSGCEQVTVPSMFCCVKESISASDHIKPLIKSPPDVYSLPEAEIREGYMCYDMLRRMAYKYKRTNGKIPVYITDIQGPFSCAAQIWGIQDFLCSLNEYPNEAHHLLSLCADAIIKYYHAMYDAIGADLIPIHCFPLIWVPKDCGVAVSDDFFDVVGANTVKEFSVPYLEKIGGKFGGITLHTCGSMNHLPEVMNAMKTLRAVNFGGAETDLMKYARECDPRITILVHRSGLSKNGLPMPATVEEILRHRAEAQKATGVKVFASPNYTDEPIDEANRKRWEDAARLT